MNKQNLEIINVGGAYINSCVLGGYIQVSLSSLEFKSFALQSPIWKLRIKIYTNIILILFLWI
jgi:hypothetical protein